MKREKKNCNERRGLFTVEGKVKKKAGKKSLLYATHEMTTTHTICKKIRRGRKKCKEWKDCLFALRKVRKRDFETKKEEGETYNKNWIKLEVKRGVKKRVKRSKNLNKLVVFQVLNSYALSESSPTRRERRWLRREEITFEWFVWCFIRAARGGKCEMRESTHSLLDAAYVSEMMLMMSFRGGGGDAVKRKCRHSFMSSRTLHWMCAIEQNTRERL